jgi:hypothetical protein
MLARHSSFRPPAPGALSKYTLAVAAAGAEVKRGCPHLTLLRYRGGPGFIGPWIERRCRIGLPPSYLHGVAATPPLNSGKDCVGTWQAVAINVRRRVPQLRAVNGFRTVIVDALDSDNDDRPRTFSGDREASGQGRIGGYRCAAFEAQTLGAAGNQEVDRNAGIPNDVTQALDSIVAVSVGDQERLLVQDPNEARSVPARRTVDAVRSDRCEGQVRCQFYEGPVRGDQRVRFFRNRSPGRSVVKRF